MNGILNVDELLDVLDKDRAEWTSSAMLRFPASSDRSPMPSQAGPNSAAGSSSSSMKAIRSDADHLCAVVAENAYDNNAKAKPTHLHFTAGQQQFLNMVRDLAANVGPDRLQRSRAPGATTARYRPSPGTHAASASMPSAPLTPPRRRDSAYRVPTGSPSAASPLPGNTDPLRVASSNRMRRRMEEQRLPLAPVDRPGHQKQQSGPWSLTRHWSQRTRE